MTLTTFNATLDNAYTIILNEPTRGAVIVDWLKPDKSPIIADKDESIDQTLRRKIKEVRRARRDEIKSWLKVGAVFAVSATITTIGIMAGLL